MEAQPTWKLPYILYHNRLSICSIMVRYTLAIRGIAKDTASEMVVEEREIDIFHEEQLEESYLCDVNPKGQVSWYITALNKPCIICIKLLTSHLGSCAKLSRISYSFRQPQDHHVYSGAVSAALTNKSQDPALSSSTGTAFYQLLFSLVPRQATCCRRYQNRSIEASGAAKAVSTLSQRPAV